MRDESDTSRDSQVQASGYSGSSLSLSRGSASCSSDGGKVRVTCAPSQVSVQRKRKDSSDSQELSSAFVPPPFRSLSLSPSLTCVDSLCRGPLFHCVSSSPCNGESVSATRRLPAKAKFSTVDV